MGRIFLCYAKEDQTRVQEVYAALRNAGFEPWMDKPPLPFQFEGIRPGQYWETALTQAIKESSYFLAFLSRSSVAKRGYVQREYRLALANMAQLAPGHTFLVPVLLEKDCPLPDVTVDSIKFDDLQWLDLETDGLNGLVSFLEHEMSRKGDARENTRDTVLEIPNIPEFLDAIGSNRTLKLNAAAYLWPPLEAMPVPPPDHIRLERVHDGWQLIITDVQNLQIEGTASNATQILVSPRYSFVLYFANCTQLSLRNLILAHSPSGYCQGGVVKLEFCKDIAIKECHLNGCGTVGLDIRQTDGLVVEDTRITHCTSGIMTATGLSNARFHNVEFRENTEHFGMEIKACKNVEFDGCDLAYNISNGAPLFDIDSDSAVTWKRGRIFGNQARGLHVVPRNITFIDTDLTKALR